MKLVVFGALSEVSYPYREVMLSGIRQDDRER